MSLGDLNSLVGLDELNAFGHHRRSALMPEAVTVSAGAAPGCQRICRGCDRSRRSRRKPVVESIELAGGRALAVGADISDENGVAAEVELLATEFGAPTVLVDNVGITRDNLLFRMTVDD